MRQSSSRGLHDFIRDSMDPLVTDWTARIRTLSPARELSRPVLVDHLPQILARLADIVEAAHTGKPVPLADAPKMHALDRLGLGFDLEQVIKEYSVLRQCIFARWEREVGPTLSLAELQRLDAALDQSITESSVSFAHARERMLRAINRIAEAAVGAANLDVFLREILQATLETTEAVDTAAVLLREGEVLTMRAAVGLEEEVSGGFTLKMGEGLAGKIAAEGKPIQLRHAATDPIVKSQVIRDQGVRALYGVPLNQGNSVIGVAYMGSRTAFEFSEEDRLLFRTMASRATAVIVQSRLVTDLERTLADRDRLVTQLAGERTRLEQILNDIPAGVLIAEAPTAEISYVNQRCQEILGVYLPRGAPVSEYSGWRLFHFDGRPYEPHETPRIRALRGERLIDEFKVQRADGGWRIIRAHAAPVHDTEGNIQSAIIAFGDISAQKRDEDGIRFLGEVSRQLAESVDYETTLALIARLAIPKIADWFAVDLLREGDLGTVIVGHADSPTLDLTREVRRRFPPQVNGTGGVAKVLREGQPELYEDVPAEVVPDLAPAAERARSAMIVPLKVRGQTVGAITFVSSGSGRRFDRFDLGVAEGLADRAATAIENSRLFQEAERAIRAREDVLAVVSHDLRNPLGSINMSAALLLKRDTDARARKQLDTILRSASRMDRLIGDLLDMASIQAGRLAVERRPQEMEPIFTEAVEAAEPLAVSNGQTLASKIDTGEARCAVDRDRILQLLSNLLGNAKKFCPIGGTITVRATVRGDELECSVHDTGPGMPEHVVPRIFDPYWSASHDTKKGVGLGLYISKGIVEAHGGHIWVDNHPGAGVTFFFTLPVTH